MQLLFLLASASVGLTMERITHAAVCLVFHVFNQGNDGKSVWFISTLFQTITAVAGGTVGSIFRLASVSIRSVLWCALLLMLWGLVYFCAVHYEDAMIAVQRSYNSNAGGMIRLAVVVPLELMELLWYVMVPVYNLVVYCVSTIPSRILLENVLRNMGDIKNSVVNLAFFIEGVTQSLYDYILLTIKPPDSFDPNLRILDLITPLSYLRLFVSYILVWLGHMCSVASSVVDIIMYPFLDINFGLAVHSLVNSALTLVIQVPAVTIQRCRAGGGPMVYCLPDFEPVIELAVDGVRSLGLLVDNWLDVTTLIIQAVLTNTSPACSGWTAVDFHDNGLLMGSNETIVVGVDDGHFAKTDGWNIELFSRSGLQQTTYSFPLASTVVYGIAVVSASADALGLMGCACTDQAYGMQIVCAVAPLDTLTPSYYVPVEFDVPSTSFYMGCAKSKIRLESIRWPVTRLTSPNTQSSASPVAQAALWVRPDCSSEHIDVSCIETFKLANCFPFCMALWTKGSTGSMVLRSADEWANSVSMVSRDCGLHSWDLVSGSIASLTQTLRQNSGVTNTWMDGEVQLNGTHCVYAPNTFSRMLRNATQGAYDAYRYELLPGQPFAFAGDLALTAVNTVADVWGIDVQRVWGNQANEFTMVHVNKFIPALPPCSTPRDCTDAAISCGKGHCRVAVPYSFDSTPWANVPAVSTDRYAFWVTNPSLSMYKSFNLVCQGLQGSLAFQAESSYSGIRVWRIDPYEFCPTDSEGVRRCPEDTSATFATLPGFISMNNNIDACTQWFLVVAPTLTFVNEYNLALSILNTTFANVDTDTLRPLNASLARSHPFLLLVELPAHLAPDELSSVRVHVDPGRLEDVIHFGVHAEVGDDSLVDFVEDLHSSHSSAHKCIYFGNTVLEFLLIALMGPGDAQQLLSVRLDLRVDQSALGAQRVGIGRHVSSDELHLIGAENHLLLIHQRVSKAMQFFRERHHISLFFLRVVFFCQNGVECAGHDVAPVPNARQYVDVCNQLGAGDALGRIERARGGDAFGDEERHMHDEVQRLEAFPPAHEFDR